MVVAELALEGFAAAVVACADIDLRLTPRVGCCQTLVG